MAEENKYVLAFTGENVDDATGKGVPTVDFVVEQGTSGIWVYRKWASGIAECWGYDEITEALQNVSGGMYYGAAHNATFPSGLFASSHGGRSGLQSCQITVDGNALLWYGTGSTYTRTQTYYLANPAAVASSKFYVSYHASGWWK